MSYPEFPLIVPPLHFAKFRTRAMTLGDGRAPVAPIRPPPLHTTRPKSH